MEKIKMACKPQNPIKKKPLDFSKGFTYLAPRPGLEPGTYGLTVRRSTN